MPSMSFSICINLLKTTNSFARQSCWDPKDDSQALLAPLQHCRSFRRQWIRCGCTCIRPKTNKSQTKSWNKGGDCRADIIELLQITAVCLAIALCSLEMSPNGATRKLLPVCVHKQPTEKRLRSLLPRHNVRSIWRDVWGQQWLCVWIMEKQHQDLRPREIGNMHLMVTESLGILSWKNS